LEWGKKLFAGGLLEWSKRLLKVQTAKLPKSLLQVDVELDHERVEKGLNRAAQRISQKYNVPGFRKGKAPRFIIENYFGREMILEEASQDLVSRGLQEAMEQEKITPVGTPTLISIDPAEPFSFRVNVPISPTVKLPNYHTMRLPLEIETLTPEMLEQALAGLREKHVSLRELDAPRPAQTGDQITAKLRSFLEDEPLDEPSVDEDEPESEIVLEENRILVELYQGLLGINLGEERVITACIPDDHPNVDLRGKNITFKVTISNIRERILPSWEELPGLENTTETAEEFHQRIEQALGEKLRFEAEHKLFDTLIDQIIAQTEYDIPDAMLENVADRILENQGEEFKRYGTTLEQVLKEQGISRDAARQQVMPEAEHQAQLQLAMVEVANQEGIVVSEADIKAEAESWLKTYYQDQDMSAALQNLPQQFLQGMADAVFQRKVRQCLVAIATSPEAEGEGAPEAEAVPEVEAAPEAEAAPES